MKKVNLTAYTDAASYNNGKKNFKDPENSSSFGIIIYDRNLYVEFLHIILIPVFHSENYLLFIILLNGVMILPIKLNIL